MHTVIETPAYLASAKDEAVTEAERREIVTFLAQTPTAGVLIPGSGGARKLRFAARGRGKRGGYRIITFYAGQDIPVFLLDIYSKDTQATLSQAELNELRTLLTDLPTVWRAARTKRRPQ